MVVLSQVYGKCLFACTTIKYNYAVGKTRATLEMSFDFTVINSSTFIKTAPGDKKKKKELTTARDLHSPPSLKKQALRQNKTAKGGRKRLRVSYSHLLDWNVNFLLQVWMQQRKGILNGWHLGKEAAPSLKKESAQPTQHTERFRAGSKRNLPGRHRFPRPEILPRGSLTRVWSLGAESLWASRVTKREAPQRNEACS